MRRLIVQRGAVDLQALSAFAVKCASIGLSYLQNIVLAHCMRPSSFGEYAIGVSVAMSLGIFVAAGQPAAIVRFWPQYAVERCAALARGALRFGYGVTLISSLAFAGVVTIAFFYLGGRYAGFSFLVYAAPLTVAWAFSEFLMGTLRAKGSVLAAIVPRDVLWRVAIISLGSVYIQNNSWISSSAVLLWSALILFLIVGIQAVYSGRLTSQHFHAEPVRFDLRHWTHTGVGLWLATTIGMIQGQIDTPLVGVYLNSVEAGNFFVIQKTASLLTVVLLANNVVAAPIFARLYHSGQFDELRRVSALFAISVSSLSSLIYLSYIGFGHSILSLFGSSYPSLTGELQILATGYFIDALCGPAGILLLLSGHEQLQWKIAALILIVRIALQMVLLPLFGFAGAVVASAFSQALGPIILCILIRRMIGVNPSIFGAVTLRRTQSRALIKDADVDPNTYRDPT